MAIIYSYPYDQTITDTDAWVGTDSVNRQTKQYTAKAVADYLNINGKVAIAGQMNYQFVQDPSYKAGTFAFAGSGGDNTPWSSITSIVISNMDLSGQIVSPFLEYLIDEQVMFQDVADKASFGHYVMRGYAQIGTTNFYTLTLEYIGGNGSTSLDSYYTLVNFYLESAATHDVNSIDTSNTQFISMTPTSPTTGDVTITALLSATGTPDNTKFLRGDNIWSTVNLQSVLTVGNTYVNANGYGIFTLNDTANDDGNITFVNTNEGWGYQISAEEGFNITNGSGTNLMSIYSSGLSIRNGAHVMNIGTNALTATRNVYFPDASGTIALTSDIPSPGPSGSGTTNYTARWTSASALGIGVLYDNGTGVGIGINGTYTDPPQRLTVVSDDDIQPVAQFKNIGNGGGLFVRTDSTTRPLLQLFSGSSYRFVVKGTGDVGIGTTSPTYELDVTGSIRASVQGRFGNGSASAPAYSFHADSDTGMYRATTNALAFSTSGSERVRITSDGNVGIGTNSPSEKLHVFGGAAAIEIDSTTNEASLKYDNSTTTAVIKLANNDLKTELGGSEKMRILANGNVGIGTTSPASKLHVTGDIRQQGSSYSVNIAGGTSINGDNHLDIAANGSYLNLRSPNNSIFYRANSDHAFRDAGGSNEYLRIKTSGTTAGNVGIGTTSPSQKLEVAGNVKLDGDNRHIYFGGNNTFIGERSNSTELELRGGGNSPAQTVYIDNTGNVGIGNSNPTKNLEIGTNAAAETEFRMHSDESGRYFNIQSAGNFTSVKTTGSQNLILDSSGSAGYITMVTNASERMRINYNGNVGIGTTSPSEKLDVRGNVYIETSIPSITLNRNFSGLQEYSIINDGNFTIEKTTLDSGGSFIVKDENGKTPLNVSMGLLNPDIIVSGDLIVKNKTGTTTNLYVQENNGNVGIGTTSPSQKLHIEASDPRIRIVDTDGTNWQSEVFTQGGALKLQARNGTNFGNISFQGDNGTTESEYARFNSVGSFGIGTNSPSEKLDVEGNVRVGVNNGFYINNQNVGIKRTSNDLVLGGFGNVIIRSSSTTVVNQAERMRITSAGNVGIGTTSPLSKLNVNGDIKIEGENELYFGSSGSVPLWEIKASGSDLVINDTGSNVGSVLFNNDEGIVLPRLTTTEINAISLPNTGLTVYNTTLNTLCFYDGSSWQKISHANM